VFFFHPPVLNVRGRQVYLHAFRLGRLAFWASTKFGHPIHGLSHPPYFGGPCRDGSWVARRIWWRFGVVIHSGTPAAPINAGGN
jgi:hypothetical protein